MAKINPAINNKMITIQKTSHNENLMRLLKKEKHFAMTG